MRNAVAAREILDLLRERLLRPIPTPINILEAKPMPTTTNDPTVLDKPAKYRTPPGQRVIHVLVPEHTFVHVHKMALESGLRFSHYLVRFLNEAFAYPPEPRAE